jgi:hypothetical protein
MRRTIEAAAAVVNERYIQSFEKGIASFDSAVDRMKRLMDSGNYLALLLNVDPLRKAAVDLTMAWMHIWSLTLTLPRVSSLTGGSNGDTLEAILERDKEAAFYYGKACASEFWLATEFPKYFGKIEAILQTDKLSVLPEAAVFSTVPFKGAA